MNAGAITALGSAWLLGGLIVAACRPAGGPDRGERTLVLALGLLVGLGVTSTFFFFASLVSARPALLAGAGELAAGLALAWRVSRHTRAAERPVGPPSPASWRQWLLASALAQAVLVAGVCGWRAYQAEPYGGWDGWAIWNLHARLMLRAGTGWPALLAEPAISWTHPDYPRLLPAAVARIWAWAGAELPAAAALVAVAFAAGGLGVLVAVAGRWRGWTVALAGGLLLVGTPFFVTFAPNQHADIPLGSFMLAAVALALLGGGERAGERAWLLLAGLCAGFAAWTKNEGLLFVPVFAVVGGGWLWRHGGPRALVAFAAGLGCALVPVAVFKFGLAPGNDLLAAPLGPRLAQLVDGARHATILGSFGREFGRFGEWAWPPYVAMALPFLAWRSRRRLVGPERILLPVLGLMLAGYYGVYLLTPQDLAWHLNNSLVRLLLQLWPLAILGWCLAVPDGGGGWPRPRDGRVVAVFFGLNFAAALTLATVLARQPAPGELALGRGHAAGMTAALGEGWFAPERHGRDRWAWSVGRAALLVQVEKARTGKPVTLRFQLRASGARTVTVRHGERVLWQGAVGGELVPVEWSPGEWPAGITRLEFSTDAPGIAEAPGDGGRVLAFALYNVDLR